MQKLSNKKKKKEDIGLDRIIITRDTKLLKKLGNSEVKVILLTDKSKVFNLHAIRLKELVSAIVMKANEIMIYRTTGPAIGYVECSSFY